ncbi:hypothetical protein [Metapseudomonas boanensis]|uniref:Heme exporter protein D n=1 Tax=Metapseudomonas boanensis TaxID=2822138 RepID=A0ABS5XKC7_9GAMM|nr:hypothetical protein [Pseudomonas boanensis]MBT8766757.1 hypothetical protein [Pseudomonas boanensis]
MDTLLQLFSDIGDALIQAAAPHGDFAVLWAYALAIVWPFALVFATLFGILHIVERVTIRRTRKGIAQRARAQRQALDNDCL